LQDPACVCTGSPKRLSEACAGARLAAAASGLPGTCWSRPPVYSAPEGHHRRRRSRGNSWKNGGDPGGIRHLWPCGKSRTCARQVTYRAQQSGPGVVSRSRWFKSGARNHLQANRVLEFRFDVTA
jgi:hypothetical protein